MDLTNASAIVTGGAGLRLEKERMLPLFTGMPRIGLLGNPNGGL
jgi:hypothetical protein